MNVTTALLLGLSGFTLCGYAQQDDLPGRLRQEITIDGVSVTAWLSASNDKLVFSQGEGENSEIYLSDKDRANVKRLTTNRASDSAASWSADGRRILFASDRAGTQQMFSMDLEGNDVKPLTDAPLGIRDPKSNGDGSVAYKTMYPREGKIEPSDLVIGFGAEADIVIDKSYISDYAWSPDGRMIAVGTVNEIIFLDREDDNQVVCKFKEHDDRMYAHAARKIQWNPTGDAVGCRIRFLGGRFGDATIFGDHEVFSISTHGKIEAFHESEARERVDWFDDDE